MTFFVTYETSVCHFFYLPLDLLSVTPFTMNLLALPLSTHSAHATFSPIEKKEKGISHYYMC
jgi:hypothetical protein